MPDLYEATSVGIDKAPRNWDQLRIEEPKLAKKAAAESAEGAARMLQHWHEGVPDDRLAHLVKDATRAFLRSLQLRLGRHDVQLGHWTFLRILWEKDGLTQVELSAEAGVMAPTTAIALKGMEELGYVVRKQRPDNRKSIYVFLTPAGKRLKAKLVPLAEEVNALAVRSLPESHVSIVRHALLTMIENLANDEQLQG